jgi:hypothetical protein
MTLLKEFGYPWDLMNKLREQILRPNDIDLVYSEPILTKKVRREMIEPTHRFELETEQRHGS